MTTSTLPISRLINVQVNLEPAAAQAQDLSELLVLGNSTVIDVTERMREYDSISEVLTAFGSSAPEYLAAVLWFEQAPQPTSILIGRWAQTASHGQLICGTLSSANTLIATWNAISSGGFSVTVDGGSAQHLSALDFSASPNLNNVASVINAVLTGATCVYNATENRFEFTSTTTGASSSVSFLTAPSSGNDISDNLNGQNVSGSGAYLANGIAAETAASVVALFDERFGQQWYGLQMPTAVDADSIAVAPLIEAMTNKHLFGVTTQEAGVLSAVSTSDIAYILSAAGYKRTLVQYSSTNAYAVASYLARLLTVDYNGNATVITMMYKQEPGITAENLTPTQLNALTAKNCNVFVAYNNNTAIVQNGVQCSGDFSDIITDTDWLAVTMQTALYNLLYQSNSKIPQTDAGVHQLVTAIESVCSQAVANGTLAPGTWTQGGFGALQSGQYLAKGFYVYAPAVASQTAADRSARRSPTIQVAAKLAGAIHTVDVIINVNR